MGWKAILLLTIANVSIIGAIWYWKPELGPGAIENAASWFDPAVVGYDVLLLVLVIQLPALLAISYTLSMGKEKTRRLRRELGPLWAPNEGWITEYVEKQFRWQDYVLGVSLMTVVVAMGAFILFIAKPVNSAIQGSMPGPGLDFSLGANLVLLGPFVENYVDGKNFHFAMHSLTAYAFGFLGAYIYSVRQLIRGYFSVDLTPSTFVYASLRILSASVMALVASFGLSMIMAESIPSHETAEKAAALLPIMGFFFGYFPDRALRTIQHLGNRVLGSVEGPGYGSTSLKKISGMNLAHSDRLEREGIDNVENLAASEPIEIALRTGFPFAQVKTWVGEARLRIHLGRHFVPFVARTGIRTYDQLWIFAQGWEATGRGTVYEFLADAMGAEGEAKKRIACKLEAVIAMRDVIDVNARDGGGAAVVQG
jgi:hypothetical protein